MMTEQEAKNMVEREIAQSNERLKKDINVLSSSYDDFSPLEAINETEEKTDDSEHNPIIDKICVHVLDDPENNFIEIKDEELEDVVKFHNKASNFLEILDEIEKTGYEPRGNVLDELNAFFKKASEEYQINTTQAKEAISLQANYAISELNMLSSGGSVVNAIKATINKIIEMIKKAIRWLIDAVKKLLDSSETTIKNAKDLEIACATLPIISTSELGYFNDGKLANRLCISNIVPTDLRTAGKKAVEVYSGILSRSMGYISNKATLLKSLTTSDATVHYSRDAEIKYSNLVKRIDTGKEENSELWVSDELLGGMAITQKLPLKDPDPNDLDECIRWTFFNVAQLETYPVQTKMNVSNQIPYLNKDGILGLLPVVTELATQCSTFRKNEPGLRKISDELIQTVNKSTENTNVQAAQRAAITASVKWLIAGPAKIATQSLKTAQALGKLCASSIERHLEIGQKK